MPIIEVGVGGLAQHNESPFLLISVYPGRLKLLRSNLFELVVIAGCWNIGSEV